MSPHTVTGESILWTLLSSTETKTKTALGIWFYFYIICDYFHISLIVWCYLPNISLALAHKFLTSLSFIISHFLSCSICWSRSLISSLILMFPKSILLYRPAEILLERFKHTFTTFKEVRSLVPFFQSLIYYNNWTVWLILTFGRVIKPLSHSIQTSSRPLLLTYTQNLLLTLFDILCFWAQCRCASVNVS